MPTGVQEPTAAPSAVLLAGGSGVAVRWEDTWRRLRRDGRALTGAAVLMLLTLACLLAPCLAPDPDRQDLALYATAPGWQHWLGTDTLGRDLFARCLAGGRISLLVGVAATLLALTAGVLYGAIAGCLGGTVDALMMRLVDLFSMLPFAVLVILLTVFCGHSLAVLVAAIGAVESLTVARIIRGQVRVLRRQPFIDAAVALGLRRRRVVTRHLLPNVLGLIIVYAALTVRSAMLLESLLSFLGLGVQPPAASWGALIAEGQKNMEEFPWLLVFPAGLLSAVLVACHLLGDSLRDVLDPRVARR